MMGGFGGCCGSGWFGATSSFGWIGLVVNLLVLIILVIGVSLLIAWMIGKVRKLAPGTPFQLMTETAQRTPKEVLDIRYARGDLTREEYQAMIADIG